MNLVEEIVCQDKSLVEKELRQAHRMPIRCTTWRCAQVSGLSAGPKSWPKIHYCRRSYTYCHYNLETSEPCLARSQFHWSRRSSDSACPT